MGKLKSRIEGLTAFIDTKQFFVENPLGSLEKDDLATLGSKVAGLNAQYQMDAFTALVSAEQQRRNTRWSVALAIVALLVSIVSAAFTVLAYYKP